MHTTQLKSYKRNKNTHNTTMRHLNTKRYKKKYPVSTSSQRFFSSNSSPQISLKTKPGVHNLRVTKEKNITIHRLHLPRLSPLAMLHIEERLLRHDDQQRNFVIYNRPLPQHKSIILGIGGKIEHTVNTETTKRDNIPLIRRYTGGGTVYITPSIRFMGIIMNKDDILPHSPFPNGVMNWTSEIYSDFITSLENTQKYNNSNTTTNNTIDNNNDDYSYRLNAQDYCLGQRKFAGNAQVITRTRFCHHTSTLWDLEIDAISEYLTLPQRRPDYRADRKHRDFLISLREHFFPDTNSSVDDDDDEDIYGDIADEQQDKLGGCTYTEMWMKQHNFIQNTLQNAENDIKNHIDTMTQKAKDDGVAPETYVMSLPEQRAYVNQAVPTDLTIKPSLYEHAMSQQQQLMFGYQLFGHSKVDHFVQNMDNALDLHFNVVDITLDDIRDVIEPYDRKLSTSIIQ